MSKSKWDAVSKLWNHSMWLLAQMMKTFIANDLTYAKNTIVATLIVRKTIIATMVKTMSVPVPYISYCYCYQI